MTNTRKKLTTAVSAAALSMALVIQAPVCGSPALTGVPLMTASAVNYAVPQAPEGALVAESDFTGLTLGEIMRKFPQDKYWNYAPGTTSDPDSWTNDPCTHHHGSKDYIYLRDNGCNNFTNYNFVSVQCDGFARKIAYDIYGSDCRFEWEQDTDVSTLKAGDFVRYNNDAHSILVTGVEGDVVHIAECNWNEDCMIDYTRTESKTYLADHVTFVAHAPYEAPFFRDSNLTVEELMAKFPQGKYWNHAPDEKGDPDSWTDKPCTHHSESSSYIYWRDHGCNDFTAYNFVSVQCDGFARKLAYDMYGSDCRYEWVKDSDLSTLKAGDVIRYNNDSHTIFVLDVQGDTVSVAECNWNEDCMISYTRTESRQYLENAVTWIAHAPYEATHGEVPVSLIGDANLDSSVTLNDAVAILQYVANQNKYPLSPQALANADCCDPGNSGVTGLDALAIQKLDARIILVLPEITAK